MKPKDVGTVLSMMEREARRCQAPVFQLEKLKTTPFRTLIFTMLSSRTKDGTSIPIVQRLFDRAETPSGMLAIPEHHLSRLLYGIAFYRIKAKNIHATCRMLLDRLQGHVPETLEGLMSLPGVGRKTANIVLNVAFNRPAIGVDTHVHRISNRLGLVRSETPAQTETLLEKIVPARHKIRLNKVLVAYGQTVCTPLSPWCSRCRLRGRFCPQIGVKKSR